MGPQGFFRISILIFLKENAWTGSMDPWTKSTVASPWAHRTSLNEDHPSTYGLDLILAKGYDAYNLGHRLLDGRWGLDRGREGGEIKLSGGTSEPVILSLVERSGAALQCVDHDGICTNGIIATQRIHFAHLGTAVVAGDGKAARTKLGVGKGGHWCFSDEGKGTNRGGGPQRSSLDGWLGTRSGTTTRWQAKAAFRVWSFDEQNFGQWGHFYRGFDPMS
jgi:hypothetical protein